MVIPLIGRIVLALVGIGIVIGALLVFWPRSTTVANPPTQQATAAPVQTAAQATTAPAQAQATTQPAPVATQAPVVPAPAPTQVSPAPAPVLTQGLGPVVNLLDGRSYEPRTTMSVPDLGFPPYEDTGIGKTRTWIRAIPAGYTVLYFGVTVHDNADSNPNTNHHEKGFMRAVKGPADVNVTITDGAFSVSRNDTTRGEMCVRVKQHHDARPQWLLTEVQPLAEWQVIFNTTGNCAN